MECRRVDIPIIQLGDNPIKAEFQYVLFYENHFIHRCAYTEQDTSGVLPEEINWRWHYEYKREAVIGHGYSRLKAENGESVYEYRITLLSDTIYVHFADNDFEGLKHFRTQLKKFLHWSNA